MTLDPTSVTRAAQAAALGLMTDACTITRLGEVVTTADGTDSAVSEPVYSGPCRVKPLTSRAQGGDAPGAAPAAEIQYTVSLPLSAVGLTYGDRVEITASAFDPSLPGLLLMVRSIERGSQVSARRVRCAEVSR